MYSSDDSRRPLPGSADRQLTAPALRTYGQIASILTARYGELIDPEHVKRVCEAAERKIVNAISRATEPGNGAARRTARDHPAMSLREQRGPH